MVTSPPQVTPAFAVPLAEFRLAAPERLNADLEALFLSREGDDYRNPTPSHAPQAETFESRFNLFTWTDPCVQELRRFMLESIGRVIVDTTTLTAADLGRLRFQNHTWFHISRYAGSFVAHNHPMASWSAVYCVRPGEAAEGHLDSGILRFFDPRSAAGSFADPAVTCLRPPYALRPLEYRLAAGQLLVFPSYVFHEVLPFYGSDRRITVATNCWFG
jgi:uncharacterized protein (TIGR02466 family)